MATKAKAGPGQSQEPRTPSGSPIILIGNWLGSRVVGKQTDIPIYDVGIADGSLTTTVLNQELEKALK